ncbi:MAG TPA: ABC transporter permease [Chloroflexota bacterium]|nr:ABC transporter permease [Chloroflexota bacterium]
MNRRDLPSPLVLGAAVAAALVVLLLAVPLVALVWRTLQGNALPPALHNQAVLAALQLSLLTSLTSLALAIVFGTPLAYALARVSFPGRGLVDALMEVPIVLPPAVAGIALLMAFGRRGLLGSFLAEMGIGLAFTPWAVVIAQCFVAIPFYVRSARTGFAGVDRELERTAYTLGASPLATFRRVTVPLAFPSLMAGAVLCWARALGEFGATIMFAGSFRGRTQTMPLAIYAALETDLGAALALGTILVVVSVLVLATVHLVTRRREASAGSAVPAGDDSLALPPLEPRAAAPAPDPDVPEVVDARR